MSDALLNLAVDWLLGHMPTIIPKWIFRDEKILEKVILSCEETAVSYVAENRPASIRLIKLVFNNHNPFPMDIDHFECSLFCFNDVIVRNLFLPLHLAVKAHSTGQVSIEIDLPDSQIPLIRNRPGDSLPLSIRGHIVGSAIGRKLVLSKELSFNATIRRD